MNSDRA
jgi:transposase